MRHALLATMLLAACDNAPCGPAAASNDECPVDSCAAACDNVDAAVACCIDTHGYGLDGDDLERLSTACEGEACDPAQYISREAALCAAQVQGLEAGVGWCGGWFQYADGAGTWMVRNTTFDSCADGSDTTGSIAGDGFQLDARSGTSLATYGLNASVECR